MRFDSFLTENPRCSIFGAEELMPGNRSISRTSVASGHQVGDGPVSGYFGAVVKHIDVGLELQMPSFMPEIAPSAPNESRQLPQPTSVRQS